MKIFTMAGRGIWDMRQSVYQDFLPDVIAVNFDPAIEYSSLDILTIHCFRGGPINSVLDIRGFQSNAFKCLMGHKAEIEGLLHEEEMVVVLADMDIRSLYILKLLQRIEKNIDIHLIAVTPLPHERVRLKRAYYEALDDLQRVRSARIIRTEDYVEENGWAGSINDLLYKTSLDLECGFKQYISELRSLDKHKVWFYDNKYKKFVSSLDKCEWILQKPTEWTLILQNVLMTVHVREHARDATKKCVIYA